MTGSYPQDAVATQVENAALALDAYEQAVFPGESALHRDHPTIADATLRSFLVDLLHYADRNGIDIADALQAARAVHDDDIAAQEHYLIGDHVQLRNGAQSRRGIITGFYPTPGGSGDFTYSVRILGEPDNRHLQAVELQQADPFGPVPTRAGPITSASSAERLLIHAEASISLSEYSGNLPSPHLRSERDALMTALVAWSGTTYTAIHEHLAPHISLARSAQSAPPPAAGSAPTVQPAVLALCGFPIPPLAEPASAPSKATNPTPAVDRQTRDRTSRP